MGWEGMGARRSMFLVYSLAAILKEKTRILPLPKEILRLLAVTAFGLEFFLFYLKEDDGSGVQGQYHRLLLVPIGVCLLSTLLRICYTRRSLVLPDGQLDLLVQGDVCWLDRNGEGDYAVHCKGMMALHTGKAIMTLQFNLHLAMILAVVLPTYAFFHKAGGGDSSQISRQAMVSAVELAQSNRQQVVETEHLLKALLEQKNGLARRRPGLITQLFCKQLSDTSSASLRRKVTGNISGAMLGQSLDSLLDRAKGHMKDFGDNYTSIEHLVLALAEDIRIGKELFGQFDLNAKATKDAITAIRGTQKVTDQAPENKYEALEKFGVDLTEMARQGKLDPNNPVVIGEPGVGKTAIAEGYGNHWLLLTWLISLDLGALIAGAKFQGEFEDRLKAVLKEVKESEGYIDEIHMVVGQVLCATSGAMDVGNLLKPMLGHGELRCIGATTIKEYRKYLEKDAALESAKIVSKWTKIPVSRLLQSEMEKLLHLDEHLHKRLIGQDPAVQAVADAIRRSRAGLADPNRPIASFMFMGPTGVGKTELAKALAEYLFDTDKALLRFDMSEYMEKHAVSRLTGAPPGYVGYEEGGQLTESVRRRPYSVVLFDEIEKAHTDVFNIFLQILDDGRVTDSQGRTVNFTNTVVIMTSNLGSQHILDALKSSGDKNASYQSMKETVARSTLRPEFMNRVDEFIVFQPLNVDQIQEIVKLQLQNVEKRLQHRKISLKITGDAVQASEASDPAVRDQRAG
ncbi:hypothetical protein SELMODRAFT_411212 [Selaginella moellendorffii]|uniref:Clp R domain-containing protein n=1 Tax=Selaginella moellendorffii TaxID=88036 RepID=D8RGX6_SELML|nr:hypothetical protein SELMODRAFT_411212 [Selaginella moellendorffii]